MTQHAARNSACIGAKAKPLVFLTWTGGFVVSTRLSRMKVVVRKPSQWFSGKKPET
jgi:hypothetical protein